MRLSEKREEWILKNESDSFEQAASWQGSEFV